MSERTVHILETAVQDFIESGEPITSERLYARYNFGIKPAMIRRELNSLDSSGYLEQLHASGGRKPTNKAYQWLVQKLLNEKQSAVPPQEERSLMESFMGGRRDMFTELLSDYLRLLSVVYTPTERELYKSGLDDLFRDIEAEEKEEWFNIINDFESLPRTLADNESWWREDSEWPRVFVGESPVTTSEHLSVIADRFMLDDEEVLVMTIGPRRMNYRKPLCLFRYFEESL